MSEQGLTWFGRHPVIGFPLLCLALPMFVVLGAYLGVQGALEEWRDEVKTMWRLLRKRGA